jgi:hypothetical protein
VTATGSTPPDLPRAERLAHILARRRTPNRAAIVAGLRRLQTAIEARGGQRKARPYLDAQLRRL